MTWVKTFPDGTTAWGDRIDGPDFTLTDESDIPVDGWRWVPNYNPDPPADDPLAAVIALLAQVTPDQLARVLALGVTGTEQLTGLPIPVPQPALEERLTAIEAILTPEAEETLKTLAAFTPETLSAGLDSAVRASVAETIKGETRLDPPSKEGLL